MEQNKPLVSMIVPIYRIDRYLGFCIESLIHQTFRNIEIILVDDGSDDRCPDICDLYKTKDSRIKVIHKANGGLVSARKAGIQAAKGAYIGYVDGDDWLNDGFISHMITDAVKYDADVVCAGFTRDLLQSELFDAERTEFSKLILRYAISGTIEIILFIRVIEAESQACSNSVEELNLIN